MWRGGFRFEHICFRPFRSAVPYWLDHGPVFTPRSSVGSRAGAPTPSEIPRPCHVSSPRHVERSMRISRTALPHLLHVEAYETYPAGATFGSAYSIVPSRSPIAPEHTYVSTQKRQDGSAFALTYILRLRSCKSSDAFVISSLPSPMLETLQMAGPLRSTDITPLHRYYGPVR